MTSHLFTVPVWLTNDFSPLYGTGVVNKWFRTASGLVEAAVRVELLTEFVARDERRLRRQTEGGTRRNLSAGTKINIPVLGWGTVPTPDPHSG